MTTSNTITKTDLQNILNEVLPNTCAGNVYNASWTADSSSANNAKLTDSITLPAGVYVITVKYPNCSTTLYTQLFYGDNTLLDSRAIFCGETCSEFTYVYNFASQMTIWVAAGMSASCTYSYKERGGLRAVQLVRYCDTNNRTLLWTNQSPDAAFASQDVILPTGAYDTYDYLEVEYKATATQDTDTGMKHLDRTPCHAQSVCSMTMYTTQWELFHRARWWNTAHTAMHFDSSYTYIMSSSTTGQYDSNLVPYKIYGIIT